ncbi:MAG: hypothetical protein IKV36_01495 [Clostridia bacterium]|nr:hypothetical protein [Clostridia bacterium]
MRKKELLLTLKKYIEKNAELESKISELMRVNEETLKKTNELLQRAENAERALELFDKNASQNPVSDEPKEDLFDDSFSFEDFSDQDETVCLDSEVSEMQELESDANEQLVDEQPLEEEKSPEEAPKEVPSDNTLSDSREPLETEDGIIDVTALENIPVNREMQYASEAIGDIVVKCATICNEFAKHGGPTCRELINLALGRTEVFKADCLTIASSSTSFSVKKECVDRIKAEAEDYFESLRAQLD